MKTLFKVLFAVMMIVGGLVFAYGLYYFENEMLGVWSDTLDTVCFVLPLWSAGVGYQRFKTTFADWTIRKIQGFKKK